MSKQRIEVDAINGYHAQNIEALLQQLDREEAIVVIKNAHMLTAKAFYCLHDFLQDDSKRIDLTLVSSELEKIFPPLLGNTQID